MPKWAKARFTSDGSNESTGSESKEPAGTVRVTVGMAATRSRNPARITGILLFLSTSSSLNMKGINTLGQTLEKQYETNDRNHEQIYAKIPQSSLRYHPKQQS